mmetsp:Transcript_29658/g.61984  ORF Transcript_29658/g.61984 Transcript_29658/m.61984 type:complete len:165 (-) Transcript_29658:570-1064(-)
MIANIKEFIGCVIVVGQQLNAWFSVEWATCTRQKVWVSGWIGFKHVTKFNLFVGLCFFGRNIANSILFHPFDNVPTKMLAIDIPKTNAKESWEPERSESTNLSFQSAVRKHEELTSTIPDLVQLPSRDAKGPREVMVSISWSEVRESPSYSTYRESSRMALGKE